MEAGTQASQPYLEASWVAPSFAAAAEIIRHYRPNSISAGWASADISRFEAFLNLLKNNYINNITENIEQDYRSNWGTSAGYAKMAIGVFLSSTTVYQSGLDVILNVLPSVIQSNGTVPELCSRNDCWHFQYTLTGLTYAAQIDRIQGDNSVFPANSNRINAGYGYMQRAFNNQYPGCASCSGAAVFPGVEVAHNYYNNSTTQSLRAIDPPYGVDASNIFLGFTTYTHYNVSGF